ncbi:hypothetical protein AVEN_124998-1 [Araneus ventricosus]|uniref:Uncharacterized protein n=1 Tax=Araneus ventricosus TaxID=182803 RepID=A0A4Y2ED58_ARAVE|nr:hypothetical protein AVEN_124998-1 [Araneus ventricosus]
MAGLSVGHDGFAAIHPFQLEHVRRISGGLKRVFRETIDLWRRNRRPNQRLVCSSKLSDYEEITCFIVWVIAFINVFCSPEKEISLVYLVLLRIRITVSTLPLLHSYRKR